METFASARKLRIAGEKLRLLPKEILSEEFVLVPLSLVVIGLVHSAMALDSLSVSLKSFIDRRQL